MGCPACDSNFKHLYCYMTCAPYQIEFVNVTKSSKETFGSKRVVDDIDYYVAADFGQAVWDSCKEVKVSSTKRVKTSWSRLPAAATTICSAL